MNQTPPEIADDLRRAKRLEWWTLAGMAMYWWSCSWPGIEPGMKTPSSKTC